MKTNQIMYQAIENKEEDIVLKYHYSHTTYHRLQHYFKKNRIGVPTQHQHSHNKDSVHTHRFHHTVHKKYVKLYIGTNMDNLWTNHNKIQHHNLHVQSMTWYHFFRNIIITRYISDCNISYLFNMVFLHSCSSTFQHNLYKNFIFFYH